MMAQGRKIMKNHKTPKEEPVDIFSGSFFIRLIVRILSRLFDGK